MSESATARANRDRKTTDETAVDKALMCAAHGCPNHWSSDFGHGRVCSAHSRGGSSDWPRITQQVLNAEVDRARYGAANRAAQPKAPPTSEERKAIALRMREALSDPRAGRAWAYHLRERHLAGANLTQAQIEAYQTALRGAATSAPIGDFRPATLPLVETAEERARRIAEYASERGIAL